MPGQPVVQVDAFTSEPFAGNPAAVCVLAGPADERWMRDVAREMNLSETAFVHPDPEHAGDWRLRWFTPSAEVELCGHATLAAAHVLWEDGLVERGRPARFRTLSGLLTAERVGESIELDFPATPPERCAPPPGLAEALGAEPVYVGRSRFDLLVRLKDEDEVRALEPDLPRLREIEARGVIVTAPARLPHGAGAGPHGADFVSRFFAPRVGIDEDPVTGSAHCCLGPYWAAELLRTELTGYQASPRGGVVLVRVLDGRVRLGGRAVSVLRGELTPAASHRGGPPRQRETQGLPRR